MRQKSFSSSATNPEFVVDRSYLKKSAYLFEAAIPKHRNVTKAEAAKRPSPRVLVGLEARLYIGPRAPSPPYIGSSFWRRGPSFKQWHTCSCAALAPSSKGKRSQALFVKTSWPAQVSAPFVRIFFDVASVLPRKI